MQSNILQIKDFYRHEAAIIDRQLSVEMNIRNNQSKEIMAMFKEDYEMKLNNISKDVVTAQIIIDV